MTDIRTIIDRIGRPALADATGCGLTAVTNVVTRGSFPAAWYLIVQTLAKEKGIVVPDNLFNWRQPSDASDTR